MMSSSQLPFAPPAPARTNNKEDERERENIDQEPAPCRAMSIVTQKAEEKQHAGTPRRIRGGCCPVRYSCGFSIPIIYAHSSCARLAWSVNVSTFVVVVEERGLSQISKLELEWRISCLIRVSDMALFKKLDTNLRIKPIVILS